MKLTTGTISATGSANAVQLDLNLSGPDVAGAVGVSGAFTGLTVVVEGKLVGGTIWYPLVMLDRKTGVKSNGSAAVSDNATTSWLIDTRGFQSVRVYASALTGSFLAEIESGQKSDFDGPISLVTQVYTNNATYGAGLTLSGATGANVVSMPDNLADALSVSEGANAYLTFVTTDGSEAIALKKNTTLAGTFTGTSASASALTVGRQGATNPALQVDASTATCLTGLRVKAAGTGAGLALSVVETGGTNNALSVDAMGAGQISVGGTSTGVCILGRGAAKTVLLGLTKTDINTQNAAPTIAQWLGGYITHNSQTGAGTLTTPTGAAIDAGYTGPTTNDSFVVYYNNRGNQTVTLTAGDGAVTLKGTVAIPTLKSAIFLFSRTGAGTWDVCSNLSA